MRAKPFIFLAPRDGLEPPTKWLKSRAQALHLHPAGAVGPD